MAKQKELWFGIDPGLVRTGIVCAAQNEVLEYATYSAGSGPDFSRAIGLAQSIVEFVIQCYYEHGKDGECSVKIALELPIYKRNAKTLIKQIRLYEEIESQLFGLCGEFAGCTIYEINPSQSKLAATGDGKATKDAIIAKYPDDSIEDLATDDAEAVADAWAHYRAGLQDKYENRIDMTSLALDLPVNHERTL